MGGKRPDQYQITPEEGGATDYKNLPQKGQGKSSADDTAQLDRQRVAGQEAQDEVRGDGPFNPGHPAPSVHARAGERVHEEGEVNEEAKEREMHGTEDPRDRGVGA